MSFNKIRLELARDHDFPDGSRERGYESTAPLGKEGRISQRRLEDQSRPLPGAAFLEWGTG